MLPPAKFFAVEFGYAERFDSIEIVEGINFKSHYLTAHFTHFFVIIPLLFDYEAGHDQHKRRSAESKNRHNPVIVKNQAESGDKVINSKNYGGKPAYGIAADSADVASETVEDIAVCIVIESQPVGVNNLVKDIRLNVVADIYAYFRIDSAENTAENKTEDRTANCNGYKYPQLAGVVACDNITLLTRPKVVLIIPKIK